MWRHWKKYSLATLIVISIQQSAYAGHIYLEKTYQRAWCDRFNGITEFKLCDRTRIDCLTENYAVEFDFASKWAECLGQALHYADMIGKNPACVLIVESKKDWKHYKKLHHTAKKHNVKVWYITPKQIPKINSHGR